MKNNFVIDLFIVIIIILFSSAKTFSSDTTKTKHPEMKQEKSSDHHNHGQNAEVKTIKKDDSIVRKGTINVESIDSNKDGKVYQDPMDWNVISDKPGKCPLCKMNLEEVSIKQAKENLKKNGYKVK